METLTSSDNAGSGPGSLSVHDWSGNIGVRRHHLRAGKVVSRSYQSLRRKPISDERDSDEIDIIICQSESSENRKEIPSPGPKKEKQLTSKSTTLAFGSWRK